jgi:hypothetical protein
MNAFFPSAILTAALLLGQARARDEAAPNHRPVKAVADSRIAVDLPPTMTRRGLPSVAASRNLASSEGSPLG